MSYYQQIMSELQTLVRDLGEHLTGTAPRIAGALALVLLGLGLAFLARTLSRRILAGLDRMIPGLRRIQHGAHLQDSAGRTAGRVLFWMVLLFFVTAATEVMGLPVVSVWLSGIVLYLPRLLAAVLILFAGLLGGHFLRDLITSTRIAYANALGRLGQVSVLVVSALIAVDQAGLNVDFLTSVLLLVLGSGLLGSALTFALGARTTVANILASYYLQKTYRVGHRVRVGEFQGEILDITATSVLLETGEGRVSVPASLFGEQASILLVEKR